MKFKILLLGVLAIVIVALLFTLLKEDVKVPNVNEAFALLKENYSADISNNYSVINITNGWKFEFIKIEGNCSLECIKRNIYFEVYKNGSIMRSENSTNITIIENEKDALNYVLYRFPEFKNISKCEFEEKLMCHEDVIIEKVDDKWNVTFMNESKGCNNECVIRYYYSFLVEKDGEIKDTKKEKIINIETILGTKNYESIDQYTEEKTGEKAGSAGNPYCVSPVYAFNVRLGDTINIKMINECGWKVLSYKKKYYELNTSIYNILLEKFSVKTITNESDVLEAFERYLKVFWDSKCADKELILNYKGCEELKLNEVRCEFLKLTSWMGDSPKVVRNGDSWLLSCSTACAKMKSPDGLILHYKVKITNKGAVYIINKNETICKRCALVGLIQ